MIKTAGDDIVSISDVVRVSDFMHNGDIAFSSAEAHLAPDDTLMTGAFSHRELRRGLSLHTSNVVEERAFRVETSLAPEFACVFFLEGEIDLSVGDRRLLLSAHGAQAFATAVMTTGPEPFVRVSPGRQRVRHVVVSASPEWMRSDLLETIMMAERRLNVVGTRIVSPQLAISSQTSELIRQVFSPPLLTVDLQDLYLESRAVELLTETITALLNVERRIEGGALLRHRDIAQLEKAKAYIAANLSCRLMVEDIAHQAGVSVTGLQRLFRSSEGFSVFEYVRKRRLHEAHNQLVRGHSIQEAAGTAGYTSAANFATAFRQEFGVVPSAVRPSFHSA
jgi:AraC-like DNA-binding protein